MPHQVTAGLVPLFVAHMEGSHPGLTDGPIDELSVGAIGATVSYGFTFWRHLETRVRAEYIKPFPGRVALRDGLHMFRGVVAASGVLPLIDDDLQIAFGPEVGLAALRLTEIEAAVPFDSANALGYTVSFAASVRGWLTFHTGLWAEVSVGAANAFDDGVGVATRWPLRLTLGWADRF